MKKLFILIVAVVMSMPAMAQNPKKQIDHGFQVAKSLEIFNSLYRDLDVFYVDSLNAEELITKAIDYMLNSLDPYTEYYSEDEMEDLRMISTGKYGGIGSIIRMRTDSTVIISEPYEGMPAAEVGLKVGDVLLKIDNTDLKGKTVSQVSEMLRGEPGTTFMLQVRRPGEEQTREFKITRQKIKTPAIPYYGILRSQNVAQGVDPAKIGYINLTQFTENCSAEVRNAVISLKEKGAECLVIDIRGNGGGLLSEAVEIVNLFVPKGVTIVETKGKAGTQNSVYQTKHEALDVNIPLCVLVNGNSASASEILAGSLQDLDRAVILGSRTYGKGLVQSQRELPYNGALKLTTAKYYIVSGRCIQAIDYKRKRQDGDEGRVPDSLATVFYTKAGRKVLDGNGIKPDVEIKHDTLSNIVYYLSMDDILTDWANEYERKHNTIPPVEDFEITDEDFERLKQMAIDKDFKYDRLSEKGLEALKKTAQFEGYYDDAKEEFEALERKLSHNLGREMDRFEDGIKEIMAMEIVKRYYFQKGQIQEALKKDEDIVKASEILTNPEEYKRILTP